MSIIRHGVYINHDGYTYYRNASFPARIRTLETGVCPEFRSYLIWWAHKDLNLGPTGYEPVALTTELWAPVQTYNIRVSQIHGKRNDIDFNHYVLFTIGCVGNKSKRYWFSQKKRSILYYS